MRKTNALIVVLVAIGVILAANLASATAALALPVTRYSFFACSFPFSPSPGWSSARSVM